MYCEQRHSTGTNRVHAQCGLLAGARLRAEAGGMRMLWYVLLLQQQRVLRRGHAMSETSTCTVRVTSRGAVAQRVLDSVGEDSR